MRLNLRALAAFLRDVCHPCRAVDRVVDRMVSEALDDDLTSLQGDLIYQALEAKFAWIDRLVDDFRAELDAICDDEYRELCERELP